MGSLSLFQVPVGQHQFNTARLDTSCFFGLNSEVSWHDKYWDAVDQFYWQPSYLGLKSIPKSQWGDDPREIVLAKDKVAKGSTLYTRQGTSVENAAHLRCLEETLNHIFDITFAIAPDAVVGTCFMEPLGITDNGPFARIGREASRRYTWGSGALTQQDGFFVSKQSAVGVELKLGAKTSGVQVLKYLALMVLEESAFGPKDELGLLYITPANDGAAVWAQCGGGTNGKLPHLWLETASSAKPNPTLSKLLKQHPDAFAAAASRLRLGHISWSTLVETCQKILGGLNVAAPGDETLDRLLRGFISAVEEHVGTGVRTLEQ